MQINMTPIGSGDFGDSAKTFVLLANAVRDEAAEGERFMTQYPPEAPGGHYRRTGTLRKSWSSNVKTGGSKIEGEVGSAGNIAPYNEDVQGENKESLFKQIGWRNVEDLQSKVQGSLPDRIQDAINKVY